MEQTVFYLKACEDYIPLIQLLKAVHLVDSGSEAQEAVSCGRVLRNGEIELRKRAKIRVGERICFRGMEILIEENPV